MNTQTEKFLDILEATSRDQLVAVAGAAYAISRGEVGPLRNNSGQSEVRALGLLDQRKAARVRLYDYLDVVDIPWASGSDMSYGLGAALDSAMAAVLATTPHDPHLGYASEPAWLASLRPAPELHAHVLAVLSGKN